MSSRAIAASVVSPITQDPNYPAT